MTAQSSPTTVPETAGSSPFPAVSGDAPARWQVTHLIAAPTVNRTLREHWSYRIAARREIRHAFGVLANEHGNRAPRFTVPVRITVQTTHLHGTELPDTDASALAGKAATDGLVDAGVIRDDSGAHVAAVTLLAPVHGDRDSLTLTVEEHR